MKASRKTKRALIPSVLAVIMCVAMLIGTTFAWFTDTASTSVNKIQAGTLDVVLEQATAWDTDGAPTTWESAEGKTLEFKKATGASADEAVLWEPGCTYELPELRISNNGNLALKYKIEITGIQGDADLNNAIEWTIANNGAVKDAAAATTEYALAAKGSADASDILTISGHMKEEAGNEYQGKSISGISITVLAAQDTVEYDSEDDQYDKDAPYTELNAVVNSDAEGTLAVTVSDDNAKIIAVTKKTETATEPQTVSDSTEATTTVMSVAYPAGVTLDSNKVSVADGKASFTQSLEYKGAVESSDLAKNTNVTIDSSAKAVAQYELTLPVAEGNETPVTVTINYTPGLTGVAIYHSGELLTTEENSGGETATYDSETGVITLKLKHASPIDIVYDRAGTVEVKNAAELTAALANPEVSTIVLGADITSSMTIPANKSLTLDLGDKNLTNTEGKDTIYVELGATLTITGSGKVDNVSHGKAAIYNNGTVTLSGGTYTRSAENSSSNTYYNILNHGTMTINSGVTVKQEGGFSSLVANGYYDYSGAKNTGERNQYMDGINNAAPSLTITGGTFSGGLNTIKNDDGATLTITDGTFTNYTQSCVQNHNVATIKGGTYTPTGSAAAVVNCGVCENTSDKCAHQLTISGGTFNGLVEVTVGKATITSGTINGKVVVTGGTADIAGGRIDSEGIAIVADGSNVSVDISGGTITSTSSHGVWADNGGKVTISGSAVVNSQEFACVAVRKSTLNISGGTFTTKDNVVIGTNGTTGSGGNTITITGGTFNGNIETSGYIACGVYVANSDTVTISGGTFNITNGVGIVMRAGKTTVNSGVVINLTNTEGGITEGKVGDSRVSISTPGYLVQDVQSGYPGATAGFEVTNNTNYSLTTIGAKA